MPKATELNQSGAVAKALRAMSASEGVVTATLPAVGHQYASAIPSHLIPVPCPSNTRQVLLRHNSAQICVWGQSKASTS